MAKQSDWKNFERKCAKKFNGERIIRPDWSTSDVDVVAPPFGIECKYRKQVSVKSALKQVEDTVKAVKGRDHLIPIVVYQKPGTRNEEYVVIRANIFLELIDGNESLYPDTPLVIKLDGFLEFMKLIGVI